MCCMPFQNQVVLRQILGKVQRGSIREVVFPRLIMSKPLSDNTPEI